MMNTRDGRSSNEGAAAEENSIRTKAGERKENLACPTVTDATEAELATATADAADATRNKPSMPAAIIADRQRLLLAR